MKQPGNFWNNYLLILIHIHKTKPITWYDKHFKKKFDFRRINLLEFRMKIIFKLI